MTGSFRLVIKRLLLSRPPPFIFPTIQTCTFSFVSPHLRVGDLCAGSGHLHDDLGVPGDLPLVEGPHPDRHLDGLVLGHGGGGMALSGEVVGGAEQKFWRRKLGFKENLRF